MEQSHEGQSPRPDWRGLCEELVEVWDEQPLPPYQSSWAGVISRARTALDQPEPEVVGPTDEDCWQWYTYCPEEGLEMYSNREQAQSAARSIMGSYEVAAHSDGWHEDMESVSWGMLVPVEQAQVVKRKTADPDSEFDEWVKYELRTARYGRPATALAEGEVAELVAWLRANALTVQKASGNPANGAKQRMNRAADLLSQRQAAPVPVSERPWEREGWCDDEGRCWCMSSLDGPPPRWWLVRPEPLSDGWVLPFISACIPFNALPLPSGEPQP